MWQGRIVRVDETSSRASHNKHLKKRTGYPVYLPGVIWVEEGEDQVETAALDVDAIMHDGRHVFVVGHVLVVAVGALQRD